MSPCPSPNAFVECVAGRESLVTPSQDAERASSDSLREPLIESVLCRLDCRGRAEVIQRLSSQDRCDIVRTELVPG